MMGHIFVRFEYSMKDVSYQVFLKLSNPVKKYHTKKKKSLIQFGFVLNIKMDDEIIEGDDFFFFLMDARKFQKVIKLSLLAHMTLINEV